MAELTDEDIEFIQELREARDQGHINRRQALGLLAGVGVGGAAGYAGVDKARADPSTSDSDGNVGTPSDPADVFAEGLAGPSNDPIDVGDSLIPDTNASYDLGSSSATYNKAFTGAVGGGGSSVSIDDNLDLQSSQEIQNASLINTEKATINKVVGKGTLDSNQSINTGTVTQVNIDTADIEPANGDVIEVDTANNKIIIKQAGKYEIKQAVRIADSSNWSDGDRLDHTRINLGGSLKRSMRLSHRGSDGTNEDWYFEGSVEVEVTAPNTDVTFELYHESGSTETLSKSGNSTQLTVTRQG